MADLFAFRCQKYSVRKPKLYAGDEYNIMHHQFFEGQASRKLFHIKVTPDLHLTYRKNGGNLGLVLKMKNIACIHLNFIDKTCKVYLFIFV